MNTNYLSRVYFSRYFYSNFKSTLKVRIKITKPNDLFFYSDPYFFNSNLKVSSYEISGTAKSFPYRSYFFPVYFKLQESHYDLAWKVFSSNLDWRIKFFSLFIKLKIFNFFTFNFTKIYFNYFSNSLKLW